MIVFSFSLVVDHSVHF